MRRRTEVTLTAILRHHCTSVIPVLNLKLLTYFLTYLISQMVATQLFSLKIQMESMLTEHWYYPVMSSVYPA